MNSRWLFHSLLIAMPCSLAGQDSAADMRKGDEAMANGLWEMAALHYEASLTTQNLESADKARLAVRLAEARIREGELSKAMEILEKSIARDHPETPFWTGIVLMRQGRLKEAAEYLSLQLENPARPLRTEAAFTLAKIEYALGQNDQALTTLSSLVKEAQAPIQARAKLHQVEILLDLDRLEEARATLPPAAEIPQSEKAFATFLEAHLLLKEKRPIDAAASFQSLIDQPEGQSLSRYHAAALALADALKNAGNTEGASSFLLGFIQSHPDSPRLGDLFSKLLELLPKAPAKTDPILEKLAQWITPSEIPATGLIAVADSDATGGWPTLAVSNDFLAQTLFTRAMGLQAVGTPEAMALASQLRLRLRVEQPTHPLAGKALFEEARTALAKGETTRAMEMLESLRESGSSPELRGLAAFIEAQSAHRTGDDSNAVRLFDEAATVLREAEATTARLNAALLRLILNEADTQAKSGSNTKTIAVQSPQVDDPALAADLALERALSKPQPDARRTAIEEFLSQYPQHPRIPEARLAAANAALVSPTPDLSFARAQLDTLATTPDLLATLNPVQIALARLRIQDIGGENQAAITSAREILAQHPGDPATAEAALVLGRNLFQTASYNDARLVLEKLAATDTDPGRAQAAWLLAARSAALVPTSQSQQEALILFDKVIESKGSLTAIARLEKARLMIDMNRLEEAITFLRKWFESLPATDPLHLPAGLLLGEAIYAQGSIKNDSLSEALTVYDQLLTQKENNAAIFNRLQYLRGRTLEQIPDPKDPGRKQEREAFMAYYSVLETTDPPAEWHYFELCGFRALALLEKSQRWPAAIACARKIASFQGPRTEEASTRAAQLQLKHMIWEDN